MNWLMILFGSPGSEQLAQIAFTEFCHAHPSFLLNSSTLKVTKLWHKSNYWGISIHWHLKRWWQYYLLQVKYLPPTVFFKTMVKSIDPRLSPGWAQVACAQILLDIIYSQGTQICVSFYGRKSVLLNKCYSWPGLHFERHLWSQWEILND